MLSDILQVVRAHFMAHGYWTLALTLLLENAGIPVPGESVLLFSSFLAHEHSQMNLGVIILVGTIACTFGDNLGYWIGHQGGRPFLDRHRSFFHISDRVVRRGEKLFDRYGTTTILFARFIFGMRVIAGPLAGVLGMPWRKFVIFNFLGAAWWVATVSTAGYLLGHHWDYLMQMVARINGVVILGMALLVLYLWRRNRPRVS